MLAFSHNIMSPIRHVYARVFYKIKYVNVVPQKRTVAPTFPAVNLNPWSQIRLIIQLRMYVRRDASFPHTEFLPLSRSGVKSRLKWSRVLKVKQQCYELRVRVFLRRLPVRWTNELESVWPNLSILGSIWQLKLGQNWTIERSKIVPLLWQVLTTYLKEQFLPNWQILFKIR